MGIFMIDQYGKRNGKLLSRRGVLRGAIAGVSTIAGSSAMKLWGAEQDDVYEGPLLVTLQLEGGVDVTQLCDPKVNVQGEPKINHWADAADPGQAGNILFAPIADNAQLFQEFGSDMLVINGVDAQTNSHETGKLFNWTGSNTEGRPSLSALFAAAQSPNQPLAYSVFGGTSRTAGLIGYNQFSNLSSARTLVQPYLEPWSGNPRRSDRRHCARALHGSGGYQSLTGRAQSQRAPASKLCWGTPRRAPVVTVFSVWQSSFPTKRMSCEVKISMWGGRIFG